MANPTGSTYLAANAGYTWVNGDIYQIQQTDQVEGAATGASFSGQGVENQPHQVLLNKVQWLYNLLTNQPHGQAYLGNGTGTFTVPAHVTAIWLRMWGRGGNGGGSVANSIYPGSGGGGGGYCEGVLSVTPGQGVPWIANASGTQIGSWIAGPGGNATASTSSAVGLGGAAGTASGAPITINGMGGQFGHHYTDATGAHATHTGEGGASVGCGKSYFGVQLVGTTITGSPGIFFGQGGGGGASGGAGGAGYSGILIIQW